MTAKIGDINQYGQKLIEKTEQAAAAGGQEKIWILECQVCLEKIGVPFRYGANQADFATRRCPMHDNGKIGEEVN